jgi:hypothetical protein
MANGRKRPLSPVAAPREVRPMRAAVARAAAIPTLATLLALGCRQPAPVASAEPAPSVTPADPTATSVSSAPSASAAAALPPPSVSASASAVASAPPCASSAQVASSARPAPASSAPFEPPGLVGLPPNPNVNVAGGVGVVNPSVVGTTPRVATASVAANVTVAAGSSVPGADAVVAKNRWRFRACANKAVALDPTAGGTVKAVAKVDAEGKVIGVTATGGSPAALTSCIQGAFYSMVFAAPDRADASVVVAVTITKGS